MITAAKELFKRASLSDKQIEEVNSVLSKKIAQEHKQVAAATETRAGLLKDIIQFIHPPIVPHPPGSGDVTQLFLALKDFEKQDFEQKRIKVSNPIFDYDTDGRAKALRSIDDTLRIISPPYDLAYSNGGAGNYADKDNGEFGVFSVSGSAVAWLGIYLSAVEDVAIKVTAYVPILSSWRTTVSNRDSFVRVTGSVSVLIIEPETLHSVSNPPAILFDHTQQVSDTVEGPETLTYLSDTGARETYGQLKAGRPYIILVHCEALVVESGRASGSASINCKMPYLVIKPH